MQPTRRVDESGHIGAMWFLLPSPPPPPPSALIFSSQVVHCITPWCLHSGASLQEKQTFPVGARPQPPTSHFRWFGTNPGRVLQGPMGRGGGGRRSGMWPHCSPNACPEPKKQRCGHHQGRYCPPPLPAHTHTLVDAAAFYF